MKKKKSKRKSKVKKHEQNSKLSTNSNLLKLKIYEDLIDKISNINLHDGSENNIKLTSTNYLTRNETFLEPSLDLNLGKNLLLPPKCSLPQKKEVFTCNLANFSKVEKKSNKKRGKKIKKLQGNSFSSTPSVG
jgi:hypothetical protein